jgi:hypothetical protein
LKNKKCEIKIFLNLLLTIAFIFGAILELSRYVHCYITTCRYLNVGISKELELFVTLYVSAEGSPRKVQLVNRQTGIF